MLVIHADGLCEPVNPGGIACYGWVAFRDGVRVADGRGVAARGPDATNNVAEYAAVIRALEWALANALEGEKVVLRSDSQLVIRQLSDQYEVRSPRTRPLHAAARDILLGMGGVRLEWVPRERNREADRLSRMAYAEALTADRRARAAGLSVRPLGGGRFLVGSPGGPAAYEVDLSGPSCQCPDFARNGRLPGFMCKHIIAAAGLSWQGAAGTAVG